MVNHYTPKRGDIVLVNFSPQAGKEIKGKRPALVLSSETYNKTARMVIVCPITSQQKGYPFEQPLPVSCTTQGVILCDHPRTLDLDIRTLQYLERLPAETLSKAQQKIVHVLTR